jgi:ABC-type transport system involved in cytochrome c biogenesis permease subunit
MKKIINWISGLFKDESGSPSSKRFVGIISGLSLCITLYVNSYSHGDIKPSDTLVNAVALLAFGCLGLSSVDKFTALKKDIKEANKEE